MFFTLLLSGFWWLAFLALFNVFHIVVFRVLVAGVSCIVLCFSHCCCQGSGGRRFLHCFMFFTLLLSGFWWPAFLALFYVFHIVVVRVLVAGVSCIV